MYTCTVVMCMLAIMTPSIVMGASAFQLGQHVELYIIVRLYSVTSHKSKGKHTHSVGTNSAPATSCRERCKELYGEQLR